MEKTRYQQLKEMFDTLEVKQVFRNKYEERLEKYYLLSSQNQNLNII